MGALSPGAGVSPSVAGYISGLQLSNNAGLPTTAVDVAVGVARDVTNSMSLQPLAAITGGIIQAAGAWAAGNNANKLDVGARAANSTYHCFLIINSSSAAVDMLFSLSPTAPTIPAAFSQTVFRRIGSVTTDAAALIRAFTQLGDYFEYVVPVQETNAIFAVANTRQSATLSIPTGVVMTAKYRGIAVGAVQVYTSSLSQTAAGVSAANCRLNTTSVEYYTKTNNAAQIGVVGDVAGGGEGIGVFTYGWIDLRGQDGSP